MAGRHHPARHDCDARLRRHHSGCGTTVAFCGNPDSGSSGSGMTYFYLVMSGIVMGLIAAVPIGPVNLICIRRSFAFGPLNGFVSGLGAALGDGLFAAIMGFGLTWIAQMIEGYATIIELIGGAMMVWMGYKIFLSPPVPRCTDDGPDSEATNLARAMVSTFAL